MLTHKTKFTFPVLLFLIVIGYPGNSYSQISLTSENMALGGGGTAYLTGFESIFVNPANLYIQEKSYHYQISVLQGGLYHDTLLPIKEPADRWRSFQNHAQSYDQQTDALNLDPNHFETIMDRNFSSNNTSRIFITQSDLYWFGLKWVRPERSYAISARTRYAQKYELGRGFFSLTPNVRNSISVVDQSFTQQRQVLHEFSFGYAESFTYLNGLLPQLSEFIIGIAPKVVVSGSASDVHFKNIYSRESDATFWTQELSYRQQTSGNLSEVGQRFFSSGELPTETKNTFSDLMRPGGIGVGLDIGVTYLITFGDDLSVLRQQNQPTEKSLRIGLSITDLGGIYQYKTPYNYTSETTERVSSSLEGTTEVGYNGSPNEHYFLLSQFDSFTNLRTNSENEDSYELLLPTSIQAGALFQYQRIKVMGDFSYSLSDTPYNPSGLASYLGIELRPLPFLPVRAGSRFAQKMSGYYSFGSAVETKFFDLSMSVLLKSRNAGPTSEVMAISFLGLKIYLN